VIFDAFVADALCHCLSLLWMVASAAAFAAAHWKLLNMKFLKSLFALADRLAQQLTSQVIESSWSCWWVTKYL